MQTVVYLDYNASTPVDPRVMPAMVAAFGQFGNPSSIHHQPGQTAAELIEEARSRVGSLVGRPLHDVIFTSGASEAALIGLVGAMLGAPSRPNVVVAATEHKAILAAAKLGARLTGGEVRTVRVDRCGAVDLCHLSDLVDETVSIVAVMAANNETGVLAPLAETSEIAERTGALRFVDVTQLAGKASLTAAQSLADVLVCSSHKIYGPKGSGALIASRHVQHAMVPLLAGGGQERGMRGGTHNTAAIVGFGLAAELAAKEYATDAARLRRQIGNVLNGLANRLDHIEVNSGKAERLCNTVNIRFVGADSEAVMSAMPGVAVSAGSACQSAAPTQSHVLLAMGMSSDEASESLRISLGRPTTDDEISIAVEAIAAAVTRIRQLTIQSEG
jgi:cysteine desulfurase